MMLGARTAAWSDKHLPYDAEIEFLESTGTQWIILPYNAFEYSNQLKTTIEYQLTIIGRRQLSGSPASYVEHCSNSGNVGMNGGVADLYRHTLVMNGYGSPRTTFDGVEFNTSFIKSKQTSYRFAIGNLKSDSVSYPCYWKLYTVKVDSSNGELLNDLIPVRKGNVGYMYDKVSGQLFRNAGTGAFITGPDKTT